MPAALSGWFVAVLIGAAAWPIGLQLFRRFPDGGAGLAFALGSLLSGYLYFILRVAGVLEQGRGGALLAVALVGMAGLVVAGHARRLAPDLRRCWPALLLVVGVFTLAYFAYVSFRSYTGEITGTEQPMDLMYLNAALESPDYPPEDPRLAGERASYYYFGYVQAAVLTAAAGVPSSVGYNLNLAVVFASSATAMGSLAAAGARWLLPRRSRAWVWAAPFSAGLLLLLAGSLSAPFEWAAAHGHHDRSLFEAFGLGQLLPCEAGPQDCYSGPIPRTHEWYPTEFWWWFDTSRVIPGTITEFPAFSFLLGDMHPHVRSIPLVLLATAMGAAAARGRSRLSWRTHRREPLLGLLIAVVLAGLAFQNAWDVLTFAGLFALCVLKRNLRRGPPRQAVLDTLGYVGPPLALGALAYAPWWLDFSSQAEGLYPYVGEGTQLGPALLQYGPVALAAVALPFFLLRPGDRRRLAAVAAYAAWVPSIPLFAWAGLAAYHSQLGHAVESRSGSGWLTLAILFAAIWLAAAVLFVLVQQKRPAAWLAAALLAGLLLLYGSELLLIKDVFFGSIPRLNTVFKLSYQAWILLALAGGVALALGLERLSRARPWPGLLALPGLAVLALALVFPVIAVPARTEGFAGPASIDGLDFVARGQPDEYRLLRWLQANLEPGDRILEASGRTWQRGPSDTPQLVDAGSDYTDDGRLSARTGHPAPIGWYGHEIQWRGDTDANQASYQQRQHDDDRAYLARSAAEVEEVMLAFGTRYLVVGAVERARYGDLMPRFENFMDLVFESGEVRVYRLPRQWRHSTS